jgi:hypothetical protein
MTPENRSRERQAGERHTTRRPTSGDEHASAPTSHREVTRRVRDADRFALQLPMMGRVPFPRPDQLAFYGALTGLVVAELVDWPVAVAIGVGHALISGRTERNTGTDASTPE